MRLCCRLREFLRCCQRKITRTRSGFQIGHIQLVFFSQLPVKVPWFEVHSFETEDAFGSVWGSLAQPLIPITVKSSCTYARGYS